MERSKDLHFLKALTLFTPFRKQEYRFVKRMCRIKISPGEVLALNEMNLCLETSARDMNASLIFVSLLWSWV